MIKPDKGSYESWKKERLGNNISSDVSYSGKSPNKKFNTKLIFLAITVTSLSGCILYASQIQNELTTAQDKVKGLETKIIKLEKKNSENIKTITAHEKTISNLKKKVESQASLFNSDLEFHTESPRIQCKEIHLRWKIFMFTTGKDDARLREQFEINNCSQYG